MITKITRLQKYLHNLMKTFKTDYGNITCYENDIYFLEQLEKGKVFDQNMVETKLIPFLEKAETILDIGAHIGCHTLMYSKINSNANIYSFEPQSKLFSLLDHNLKFNNVRNVTILNNAVGNDIKQVHMESFITDGSNSNTDISYDGENMFNLGGLSIGSSGEEVSMITIDSLKLLGCDFIKIDVEGAEKLVLLGAQNTIKKYKPVICYECNEKTIQDNIKLSSHEIIKILGNYEIKELENSNYLAIPIS